MENPFPGMNPYMERNWRDVHHRVVTYACDQIGPRLPRDLRARIDERVFVRSEAEFKHEIYPDIRVVQRPRLSTAAQSPGAIATAEPLLVEIPAEQMIEGFIQIVEAGTSDRVITVIEFLRASKNTPFEQCDSAEKQVKSGNTVRHFPS